MNIIRLKNRDGFNVYVVVDRGEEHDPRFVSAVVNPLSMQYDEWVQGNYFKTEEEAIKHFHSRG